MFNQYKFIPEEHKIALQSVIQRHMDVTTSKLAHLYEVALSGFTAPNQSSVPPDLAVSRLTTEALDISVATDRKTGFYLQLAHMKDKPKNFLTMGQKWAMEQADASHSTINTVYW